MNNGHVWDISLKICTFFITIKRIDNKGIKEDYFIVIIKAVDSSVYLFALLLWNPHQPPFRQLQLPRLTMGWGQGQRGLD